MRDIIFVLFFFLLPHCMCHRGYTQGQRPAGRASWPAALCTSSLPHIWMYLRNHHKSPESVHTITKAHHSTHSSNIFLCSSHQHNSAEDAGSRRRRKREESRGAKGKQFNTFRKKQMFVRLGIEPTPPISLRRHRASLHTAWW